MSIRSKIMESQQEITPEQKREAYLAKKAELDAIAFGELSYDRQMVQVLSAVPQRGYHRWAYEIVALDNAGIYKGGSVQVEEAKRMIAGWEGKSVEPMKEAA